VEWWTIRQLNRSIGGQRQVERLTDHHLSRYIFRLVDFSTLGQGEMDLWMHLCDTMEVNEKAWNCFMCKSIFYLRSQSSCLEQISWK
jgi:hypothetical protein